MKIHEVTTVILIVVVVFVVVVVVVVVVEKLILNQCRNFEAFNAHSGSIRG